MIKRFYILLLAIVASVGMSFAQDPGIVSSGTKGGMSYTFYDNGLLEISGSGALPGSAFTNWSGGFGASVKNIRFAEDCEVYGLNYMWFACYTEISQLETIEINSVAPIMFTGTGAGITYKQSSAVTLTITAPGIVDVENSIIRNYGSPVNMIFNMPATTVFEKKWFSGLDNYFAVTIPTGAKGRIPAGYVFTDPYIQKDYEDDVAHGHEADFWEKYSYLEEGKDYTFNAEESTFVITAENASQFFGQATVSFQTPTEASNSEWVLWKKSDLKEFSDMSSGGQKVCKDVTVKVNNGVYDTDSGWGIHFESLGEDGVQFVAPEGKVFKRIVILNEYGTFSDPNWSYDKNYKKWSGSANTVGFVGNICGISLIEFELDGSAPAYETVMNLINEIPNPVVLTAECKEKIDAARAAYDALSAAEQALVTNIATLTTAEAAFENVMNIWLSGDCDVILWNDTTLTVRKHAGEGNGAMADYSYASRAPWYSGHWYNPQPNDIVIKSVTIEEGVTHLGDYAFAWMSEMKTVTIPSSVTTIPDDAFYWSKAVDDIYLSANPSNLQWMLPNTADVQFKPEKATLCHVPVDLLPAYQEWLNGLNVTYVGDQAPTVLKLEVGRIFNDSDEVYLGPDTTYIQFNCASDKYLFGKGTFKIIGDEYVEAATFGIKFEPKSMSYCFMKLYSHGTIYPGYGTNCCTTARPTQMTVVSGDGTKANPFVIEPDTKGECVQAAFSTLPQAADGLLFDMTEKTLITAGVVNAGNVQYSLDNGANWSAELPKATDPGTYKVHYRVLGGNSCVLGIDYDENNFVEATIASDPNVVVWDSTFVKKVSTYRSNAGYNFNKNNVKDGITAFFEGTQVFNGFFGDELYFSGPSALLTFTHEAGKIAKAEIYGTITSTSDTEYNGWVWDADNNKLVWEGTPNATISIQGQGSGKLDVKDVTYMIFTLVPPTPEEVMALINAIGTVEYTAECKQKIDLARKTYERLVGEVAKAAVTNYSTLTQAETDFAALQSAAVQNAIDKIAAIPTPVVYTEACGNAIDAARAAYNALLEADMSKIPEASVTKLTDAEKAYADLKAADPVITKIDNIPTPVEATLATRDSINNARAAYDALTADQKAVVTNYQKLLDAEAALAALMPPASLPEGALSGKFRINAAGDQIMFAKGNLQATTTDLGATWTWGFATNQWDTIGSAGANTKITANGTVSGNGTVDLFGWSTEATYYGIHKSTSSDDYTGGVLKDWGENITSAEWRTLTNDEWRYVLQTRPNYNKLRGQAMVNGVNGYIFLPDEWELPTGLSFTPNPNNWTANVYDGADWTAMENAGAVFLPMAPRRSGIKVQKQTSGSYWTATKYGSSDSGSSSWMFQFFVDGVKTDMSSRYYGYSVRLTMPAVNTNPFDSAQAVKELIDAIPVPVTLNDSSAIYAAREAFDALSDWAKNAIDAATVQKLTDAETALNTLLVQGVIAKINNIPQPVELKLATRDSIQNARAAYDALTADQKPLVTNYQTLLDAEAALADLNPGVPPATPLDSAQAVKDLIDAIPDPVVYTEPCGDAITAARAGYDALSDAAKGALDAADVQKMTDAATQYAALDAIAAIDAIPAEIVYDPAVKAAIETAREKYDALIDASKALVDDEVVAKLTNAEKAWADLVAKVEHNVSYIGKDGELKNEIVALLHIPDPAPDFNGYEFVRWDVKAGDFIEEGLRIKAVYTPIITTNPQGFDTLAYNGLAQELVKAGEAKEGHIEYSLQPEEPESWSAELPKATFAGVYAIYYKLVREGHADYLAPEPTMATIAKVPVTYVAPIAYDTLVYNAANQTLAQAGTTTDGTFWYSLNPTDDNSWKTAVPQGFGAGAYNVYYKVVGDINHLDSIAPAPVAVTIAKAALTATADDKSVIYGDLAPQYTVTYTGWQGDDDATVLTGDIAFACEYAKGSPVGEYVITPSGVDAANYTITFVNGKVTVNRKSAKSDDITAKQADNEMLVYTAAVNKPTIQAKDTTKTLIEGTDYQLTFIGRGITEYAESVNAPIHVGEYTAIVDFIGNYKDTLTVDFVINKAPLTITAEDKAITFGEFAPEFTVSYEGFLGTDTATVLTGVQAYACEYERGNNVGEYTIIPSGVEAHDYAITFSNGKLTVNRKSAKSADIAAKQADNEKLVYDAEANRPTIQVKDTTLVLTEAQDYVLTFKGVAADQSIYAESETAPTHVGNYTAIVAFIGNYIDTLTVDFAINKAPLTITANDTAMIYGDIAPAFTVSYNGWFGNDDESVLLGTQAYDCIYAPGSPIGTYAITPKDVDAYDYAITFVDGSLTVNKAHVYVSDAEAQIAKFADGHANAVVLKQGVLNGIKLNDPIAHVTTAAFSSADVAEHLTITLFYELTGDAALLNNYNLDPTSDIFTNEGVIIEPFIPDNEEKPEDEEATVNEGIEIYAYGYCDGSGYSLKYHLESGNPDQYKIDFADSRFIDVDWTNLTTVGKDGTIDIDIPVDMPTGDYTMTVYFRDSRFDWLESRQFNVTFHVNLPETYVRPLFDNVIALVDTCNCLTDIQWYWRANSTDTWVAIPGANGYYYHSDTKLAGEYFVSAKMNGEPTYTCGQADMETLYGDDNKQQNVQVKAYPNPVVTTTTVTIEGSENFDHNLRVVNLTGVEVLNTTFEGNETTVDMNGYVTGNYMISVDGIVVKVMKK